MKKLLLTTLLLTSITSYAQRYSRKISRAPETKNAISVLVGQAIDLGGFPSNLGIVGRPNGRVIFSGINYYRNFSQWQVGLGLDIDWQKWNNTESLKPSYKIPHILANRLYEHESYTLYAGIMFGYVFYEYDYESDRLSMDKYEYTGKGIVYGLQAGVLMNVSEFFSLNIEMGARLRETDVTIFSTHTTITGPNTGQIYTDTQKVKWPLRYIPLRAGFRFRF